MKFKNCYLRFDNTSEYLYKILIVSFLIGRVVKSFYN